MNRVFIKTYGCQMNERDSESVACKLQERGYAIVDHEDKADIVLLNTCSVRERAEQKAIGKAGHLAKKKRNNPRFILGIMGCMAQNLGNDLVDRLPDLDLIVGTQKFHRLPDYLDQLVDAQTDHIESPSKLLEIGEETGSENEIREHFPEHNKVTAFVSIMQGCNMNCAFCIVPKTRGKERYRSIEDIVSEVRELSANGVREVTLLGQIVNAYGRGSFPRIDGKTPFVQLLERIHDIEAIERIRFTSPHPISFDDDLIDAYGRMPKLCSYAHLPMQSGSDRILKAMNRPYTIDRFLSIISKLRSNYPTMRISTDVIVGFPGETQKDFELTKKAFSQAAFEHAFVFKYSDRSGTPAAQFDDKISKSIKENRNQELLSLAENRSHSSNADQIGTTMEVLVEGFSRKGDGRLMGRTRCFRKVVFEGPAKMLGSLVMVRIKEASPYSLIASQL
jgi:tRNA-2-methylthio-N6-dimethylallyladenosine synthase